MMRSTWGLTALAVLAALAVLCGCAAGNPGVVASGNGLYTYSKLGGMTTVLSADIQADLQKSAAEFCGKAGKKLVTVGMRAQDANVGTYASAEIEFRCE